MGTWQPEEGNCREYEDLGSALSCLDSPLYVIGEPDALRYVTGGAAFLGSDVAGAPIRAMAPPCLPAGLGSSNFCRDHNIHYPCYAGSMAHGIASEELVAAMGTAGMLGFFGAAGISLGELEKIILSLSGRLSGRPFGINLINSPNDSDWERGAVELFLRHGIHLIEASAYLLPTPALVKYRVKGLRRDAAGKVVPENHIIAKVSRTEVARRFLEPPSAKLLDKLLAKQEITEEEAHLAAGIPLAGDITAEADSGGHTDHRPAVTILPSMIQLAAQIQAQHHYDAPPRIGLAGGIGTPAAAAAAFSMGAAYIVIGSISQACVESGASDLVRSMLAGAAQTDVMDAPAADMFEMGIRVQVLKKGTRFAERASKLFELYRRHDSLEDIPEDQRRGIEETIFRKPLVQVWEETEAFFSARNPKQVEKARQNPKHKMALVFRWYLGKAVHWANAGITDRQEDYQVWCGPSMGAFNDWTKGTLLEEPARRSAPLVALNLLFNAAILLRAATLRAQGLQLENLQTAPIAPSDFPEFMRSSTAEETS